MTGVGWVAGVTRARALRNRNLGTEGIREVAASRTLDEALSYLAATPYRHDVTSGASPAEAQHEVSATLLWHLRVLAGWQPTTGADVIRTLAAGFEISNTERHLRSLTAEPSDSVPADLRKQGMERYQPPPYRMGALATAWMRLARTRTPSELRTTLAASAWGDPGGDSPAAVAIGMRVSAAVRLAAAVPDAARWAAARLALLFCREVFVAGRRMPEVSAGRAARLLGPRAVGAGSYAEFRQALPAIARWLLEDVGEVADLWRAEARWWDVVERDGRQMLRRSHFGPTPVVGAVAQLSADAWWTRGALELAVRGGGPADWPGDRRRDWPGGRPGEVSDAPG